MKMALIQCPVWGTFDPPLALAQLSSCLEKEGLEVYVLDFNIKLYLNRRENYKNMWAWEQSAFWYDTEQVNKFFKDNNECIESYIKDIINSGARIVGFSVNAASRLFSIELAKRLKGRNKELIVVFGGPLFFESRLIDSVLNEETIDIVILGEGEVTFCELVRLIEKKQDISSCKGIAFKREGTVINTGPRELIANLDTLPFLDFTNLTLSDYDDQRHIPFMASRGCIQKCVFCSSREFWRGYRAMSGERIFRELKFHKRPENKFSLKIGHVDFLDLLFNGHMRSLIDFCELMCKTKLGISWTANMIIRPEMTYEVIKKMRESGCRHVVFGIESGSQRVLDLMRKHYRVEDADRIIRWMHEVGITVTANFMFGFPGETKEDFEMTLDFTKRNAAFLARVYPSRTYCAVEEISYFHSHLEEFDIKPNPPNHLYWQTCDGKNTYPERLKRCEEFCNLASSLGVEVGSGVQTSVELDKWYNLGYYYDFVKDYQNAIDCFLNYYRLDPSNGVIRDKVNFYYEELKKQNSQWGINESTFIKLKDAISRIKLQDSSGNQFSKPVEKMSRERSVVLLRAHQNINSQLNNEEFNSKEIVLESNPKDFFLQLSGPCNSSCVFCSRGRDYEFFDLDIYRSRFEEKLFPRLSSAERIILTGSGEFLLLPAAENILDYFNNNFPHVEKVFFTNGSTLTPHICEKLIQCNNKYTIHISLHAANSRLHNVLTHADNFHKVLGQLNYLLKLRKDKGNLTVHLIFVATTLNIEDLPNFIKLAADLGVDRVICYYNYIYIPTQKYLSCFFKQELTNKILIQARELAEKLGVKLDLPPAFGLDSYPRRGICTEPWSQIMIDYHGHILPCDASEDCPENLSDKEFIDIWNSPYYQNLRKSMIDGTASCFKHCLRANPSTINDFKSHVIHRGNTQDVSLLWGDNF